jgi:hypothetical protein
MIKYLENKKLIFITAILAVAGITLFILLSGDITPWKSKITENEALIIAGKFCTKGGGSLGSGLYNKNTKTWWFDANLNATQEGCNPACVVSEETKTAEINWRCTGLIDPNTPPISGMCKCPSGYRNEGNVCNPECYYSTPQCGAPSIPCQNDSSNSGQQCGIENCHGMDIKCGSNVAQMCTEIYMAGDNCRQFASCQTKNGTCQLAQSPKFESCKSCVKKCEADFPNGSVSFFECENKCWQ